MIWKQLIQFYNQVGEAPIKMMPVSPDFIDMAEATMDRNFPPELKHIWSEVGCGFIMGTINGSQITSERGVLMPPQEVADWIMKRGVYENSPLVGEGVAFFDKGDDILIVWDDEKNCVRFVYDLDAETPLATTIGEFLDKLLVDMSVAFNQNEIQKVGLSP